MLVDLEELKSHLKTLLPGFESGDQKVAQDEKKTVDALLDVYLWAEKRGEEIEKENESNKVQKRKARAEKLIKDEAA